MAAQSNPPASFGYTWGFADNSRSDGSQIVEISPNINYTVSDNVSKKKFFDFLCSIFYKAIQNGPKNGPLESLIIEKIERDFIIHFNFIHKQIGHKLIN